MQWAEHVTNQEVQKRKVTTKKLLRAIRKGEMEENKPWKESGDRGRERVEGEKWLKHKIKKEKKKKRDKSSKDKESYEMRKKRTRINKRIGKIMWRKKNEKQDEKKRV